MNIKKVLLGAGVVLIIILFVVYEKFGAGTTQQAATNSEPTPSSSGSQSGSTGSTSNTGGAPTASLKDGQYTGDIADAFYGQMQVGITIGGGKITDIQLLQYPNHAGHTLDVSNSSLPQLKTEAIEAQSANINVISGATQTSQAFMQSLNSALTQAGASSNGNIQVTPPSHLGA
jgi:uncharacterized protein with FMN-binding domain